MSQSKEAPQPAGPPPGQVSSGRASARVAALIVVGSLVAVILVALSGKLIDALSGPSISEQPRAVAAVVPEPGDAPQDFAGSVPGDDGVGPLALGAIDRLPNPDRLDFLFDNCTPACNRDAHWMNPANPNMGSGAWTADRPFHVREGFINNGPEPLGDGFDVVLYVTRLDEGSGGVIHPTYRLTSDYVLRGDSDRCGPTYRTQGGPETCEWFVHDFPAGLPEGRFAITAAWQAPCRAWIDLGLTDSCQDPEEVISLFSSGFDAPYSSERPDYTGQSD
jgi:hypothetical protein